MFKALVLKFSGFSIVGLLSTMLSVGLLYLFDEILGVCGVLGYVLSYTLSIFFSYMMNSMLVYKAQFGMVKMIKFFMTYVSGMTLGASLIWLVNQLSPGLNAFVVSCGVIPITMVWNFLFVNKILTKKESGSYAGECARG